MFEKRMKKVVQKKFGNILSYILPYLAKPIGFMNFLGGCFVISGNLQLGHAGIANLETHFKLYKTEVWE